MKEKGKSPNLVPVGSPFEPSYDGEFISEGLSHLEMLVSAVFPFLMSVIVVVKCQQPLEDLSGTEKLYLRIFSSRDSFSFHLRYEKCRDQYSEISSYQPSGNLEKSLLQQCESFAQGLIEENERLKEEIKIFKLKIEALEEIAEEEEEEEDENYGSDESREPSTIFRSRRAAGCEGGTLAAWACAPQCVFKLKGLCGLSLKSICHC